VRKALATGATRVAQVGQQVAAAVAPCATNRIELPHPLLGRGLKFRALLVGLSGKRAVASLEGGDAAGVVVACRSQRVGCPAPTRDPEQECLQGHAQFPLAAPNDEVFVVRLGSLQQ